jgi:hypothetical protein
MSQTEANAEILAVADALKKHIRTGGPDPIIVTYEFLDSENQFPSGLTEKYIEEAAKEIGYVVGRKGTTRASLIRDTGGAP